MELRTLVGRYAGEIRDYDMGAGRLALVSGTAERVGAVQAPRAEVQAATPAAPPARLSTAETSRWGGKRHRR